MSLASLLLGAQTSTSKTSQSAQFDGELDALFCSVSKPLAASSSPTHLLSPALSVKSGHAKDLKRKRKEQADTKRPRAPAIAVEPSGSKKRRPATVADHQERGTSEDIIDNDASLEDNYLSRRTTQKTVTKPEAKRVSDKSSEDNEHVSLPLHETHLESSRRKIRNKSHRRVKYVTPDETPAQQDARTVFVGNIPVAVVKSKSSKKQLERHFLSLIARSRIESVRFRSIAFASATTALPNEDIMTYATTKSDALSTKQQRQQERAAQWRESTSTDGKATARRSQDNEDATSEREDSHSKAKKVLYLTPAERKRVAFIKGDFHKEVDTVNAYIVFAYVEASDDHKSTAGQALHPFEAARLAVEQCDGTLFMDKTIRVDRVGQWRVGIGDGSGVSSDVGRLRNPRATLFVGNLNFEAKEEELRVWFEGVVSQERGPPPTGVGEGKDSSDEEDAVSARRSGILEERQQRWVRSVRIIRDRDTQLGKGFAYVRFLDRECVDEILGLEPSNLKFAKRSLRVQRCKVVPPSTILSPTTQHKTSSTVSPHAKKPVATSVALPKGDPSLGEKLLGLSKDERKAAKAANVDRVKRRLAKKKVQEGVKKAQGDKERKRERPRLQNKGGGKAKVVNKGRIRSEQSLSKRNAKK